MNEKDLISTVTIKQVSEGGDSVRADLKASANAQDQLAASSENLAVATENSAKRQTSAAAAFDAYTRRADPASRALAEFEKNQQIVNRAFDQNPALLDRAGQGIDTYTAKLNTAATAAENLRRQQSNLSTNTNSSSQSNPTQIIGTQLSNVSKDYAAQFAAMMNNADAQALQIGKQFGESLDASLIAGTAKSARDSASTFSAEMDRLDEISSQKAMQTGKNFQDSLNTSLIAGIGKSARDSASVFSQEMDHLDSIAQQKATQIGKNFQDDLNKTFNIGGSSKSASQSADVFKDTILAQEDAVTRLRTAINPLETEQGKLGTEMANYKTLLSQGKITTEEYAAAQAMAGNRLHDFGQNLSGVGVGSRVAANELTNLSFQVNDVISGLAMGQAPLRILTQQGGQIYQVFQTSKSSVVDFAKAGMEWFTGLFTVGRVAFGGIAAAIGTVIYAQASYASSQREVTQALIGVGEKTKTTAADINNFAQSNSSALGLSVDQARSLGIEFTKTGNISIASLKGVGDAVHGLSILTGQSVQDAGKAFAGAFSGNIVSGAEELNKTYGFLSASTRDYIRTLELQGNRSEAIQVVVNAMAKDNARAADSVGFLSKSYDILANAASKAKNALGSIGAPAPLKDQIASVQSQRDTLQNSQVGDALTGGGTEIKTAQLKEFDDILAKLNKDLADTTADAAVKELNAFTLAGNNAVRSIIPQIAQIEQLKDALLKLSQARIAEGRTPQNDAATLAIENQVQGLKEAQAAAVRHNQAVMEIAGSWGNVAQATALALEAAKNQLPVIQAITGQEQMAAQYAADYANAMISGLAPADALALAASKLEASEAAATTSVEKQVNSLKDQIKMIDAQKNGTEATTAASIAYKNAIESGADAEAAAALSSATLAKYAAQAASSTIQLGAAAEAAAASLDAANQSAFQSASITAGMVGGGNSGGYSSNSGTFNPSVMPSGDLGFVADPHLNVSYKGGGLGFNPSATSIKTLLTQEVLGKVDAAKKDDLQKWLDGIAANTKATDANTAATEATLNPLYSQGHGALAIGYYKAAAGLEGIVGGYGGTDTTEVRMMLTPGEHLKVTPQGQSNDNSRQVTNIFNFGNRSNDNRRRSQRQAIQGFAQSIAATA